ncbi:CoA ester lyase [Alkalihalobacillus sp. BA299]|uniref:HpcH/HpaI aldolase/citrate lyase family protein n=1 Tax=Alkalihalobacillus sp. BA299 TaxID=2815938 RepID=UPI001ADAC4BC|nr:CoA ester lyase [Alkalihalobacillus sp. BA299]
MSVNRLRRCELAVPASKWKFIEKASKMNVDAVFLDLEDAVAPSEKGNARKNIITALNELDWGSTTRIVRINSLDTEFAYKDIIEVVEAVKENIDIILIPKVNVAADIYVVETLLSQLEMANNISKRIGIECLIETAQGMMNVEEIAFSSPRLEAIIFGIADYSASIGARTSAIGGHGGEELFEYPGHRWNYAISKMVVAAKSAGIQAIDGTYGAFDDPEGFRQSALISSALGCDGKWVIHPNQVSLAQEIYAPTAEEIERAELMLEAYKEGVAKGAGAVSLNGKMIDAASIKLAENVIKKAEFIRETNKITN